MESKLVNHYELGGCLKSQKCLMKNEKCFTAKKIPEVTCPQCLNIIKMKGLVERSQFPDVPTFQAELKRGLACFTCPVCGKECRHGSCGSGHRVSHCGCWEKGYFLEV